MPSIETNCAIVGAGPAGLMLGLLLARAGIDVTIIEKHNDFLRDFRGDTIHPSTLEVMHELDLLDGLLALPHTQAPRLHAEIAGRDVTIADFSRLPTQCRFIAFMPQWDFLDYLARAAGWYRKFSSRQKCRSHGADRSKRPHRRPERANARGQAGDEGGARRRRRRPPFHRPGKSRPGGGKFRPPDRSAVDEAVAPARRSALHDGARPGHARAS